MDKRYCGSLRKSRSSSVISVPYSSESDANCKTTRKRKYVKNSRHSSSESSNYSDKIMKGNTKKVNRSRSRSIIISSADESIFNAD